jgi:hypothetical protein
MIVLLFLEASIMKRKTIESFFKPVEISSNSHPSTEASSYVQATAEQNLP